MSLPNRQLSIDPAQIELRKDRLDLRPALIFVEAHLQEYKIGLGNLASGKPNVNWLQRPLLATDIERIIQPQVIPEVASQLLSRLPQSLLTLSALEDINYEWADSVPVPEYDEYGNCVGADGLVPLSKFPRTSDHPTRILIGWTTADGVEIRPTGLPLTVTNNARAGWFYQLHVLLHEFFHTVLSPRTNPVQREAVKLRFGPRKFTLEEWWQEWVTLFSSEEEPGFVTRYAAAYADRLTHDAKIADAAAFEQALVEQMCESFVAFVLNIAPNDVGWTDFQAESFGNRNSEALFEMGRAASANRKWDLMLRLCKAEVVSR